MNRKHINIHLLAALLLLPGLQACENFLNLKPIDSIAATDAINNAQTAEAAIMGAYSKVQSYYSSYYISLGVMPGDNVEYNGSLSQYLQLDQNSISPENVATVTAYQGIYEAINTANSIIDALENKTIDDPELTTAKRERTLGEAYFIRALGYFDLARGWGGVQLQLKPTNGFNTLKGIKRSTQEETYLQVLSDLEQAAQLLPEDDASTRNRVQKNAAYALQARLYLYLKRWKEAEERASSVIISSKYELVEPFNTFFKTPFQSAESVFELQFSSNDRNSYWNLWYPSSLGGQYTLKPTQELVGKLEDPKRGGTRHSLIASHEGYVYGNLYNTMGISTDPVYVIRIAELYLIRAEARAKKQSPDVEGALADLNRVRQRAEVPALQSTDLEEIIRAIEDENSLEFAFEPHRWFDLVRTGRADDVLGVTDRNFWLFPLPSSDILSDPDTEQNPGY